MNDETQKPASKVSRRAIVAISGGAALGACQRAAPQTQSLRKRPDGKMYTVKRGDTLHHIADVCKLDISEIKFFNNLDSNLLKVGQKIFLPYQSYIPAGLKVQRAIVEQPLEMSPLNMQTTDLMMSDDFHIVGRKKWGALPTKSNVSPMGVIDRITLHHTSEYPGMNRLNDVQTIRKIANYHRNHLKWADIGYHYLVGRDGKIYEGRPVDKQGAHTGGQNERNLGITVIGDFMKKLPNEKQLKTLAAFLSHQMKRYNVGKHRLYGHRDLKATLCPGTELYRWLQGYRLNYRLS